MLVVGAKSLIGSYIIDRLMEENRFFEATARLKSEQIVSLDLGLLDQFDFSNIRSSTSIICAAATNMAWCEKNVEASRVVNVFGTIKLLERLSEQGLSGVYLSSSHVFDGDLPNRGVDDITSPKNQYGLQKCEVENFITKNGLPFAILRLGKVVGSKQPDRFYDWVKKVQQNERITAFNDVNFSPVLVSDAAQILIKLADSKVTGVWHLTAKDQLSYTDAIKLLLDRLGLNSSLVEQASSADIGLSRKFTQSHSVLECSKLCDSFDQELYTSKEVLERLAYQYML